MLSSTETALRDLATRWRFVDEQIKARTKQPTGPAVQAAPALVAAPGVGPEVAAKSFITAGDNADRIPNDAHSLGFAASLRNQPAAAAPAVVPRLN